MVDTDKYADARQKRQEHIEKILSSSAGKKVVVAGPGTGKTYLFKQILNGKQNTLTLSFVNALVADLSLELCGLSEVRTLHGYARQTLRAATKKGVKIFPGLDYIIREDTKIILDRDVDYARIFHLRDDANENLDFYRERRIYYDHYGFPDVIYSAVLYFEKFPDRVLAYDQVVVDEFQDFNPLEVSLIDLLASKSPVLLAGDDDQALYDFKHASSQHIRERHTESAYSSFTLPYCSRCTRVIVDAANDVINAAKKRGLLEGRIEKPYLYFEEKKKDEVCEKFPRIDYKQAYANAIPSVIEGAVSAMAKQVRGDFSVLVITAIRRQCQTISKALKKKGLNVSHVDREQLQSTLFDGLRLILEDQHCNLGWRIAASHVLTPDEFAAALKAAGSHARFKDSLSRDQRATIKSLASKLRRVRDDHGSRDELSQLLDALGIDPYGPARADLKNRLNSEKSGDASIRRIPITVTTVQSSKGLAADLVCIAYFDDQYVIKNADKSAICDQDVCNFLVALTRAKNKLLLISSTKPEPTFLGWIDAARINRLAPIG